MDSNDVRTSRTHFCCPFISDGMLRLSYPNSNPSSQSTPGLKPYTRFYPREQKPYAKDDYEYHLTRTVTRTGASRKSATVGVADSNYRQCTCKCGFRFDILRFISAKPRPVTRTMLMTFQLVIFTTEGPCENDQQEYPISPIFILKQRNLLY